MDGSYLYECTDLGRTSCGSNFNAAKAYVGTVDETQQLIIGSSDFTVTIEGHTSSLISITERIEDMQSKFREIDGVGVVTVECTSCSGENISSGDAISVTFKSIG